MPHDKYGRLIELGDFVKSKPYNYSAVPVVGRVVVMREGQTCSGEFCWLRPWLGMAQDSFGAGESEIILKADGSDPAPLAAPAAEAPAPAAAEPVAAPAAAEAMDVPAAKVEGA